MLRRLAILVALFVVATGTWAADGPQAPPASKSPQTAATQKPATTAKAKSHKSRNKKKPIAQKPVEQVQTPPPPPPPPPTLADMPPVAPEVTYRGGLLTIDARNSTMNDILTAIHRVTGAAVERAPTGGSERVVGTYGPGQPKDVISQLLNGSAYDYIILGSATRPGGIERVVLTTRANAAPATAVAANNPAPQNTNRQVMNQDNDESEPETDVEDEIAPERDQPPTEAPSEQPPPPDQQQPMNPPPAQAQPQPGQPNPNQQQQNQPQVKSPEELLRELQQMQQQQQQQQQQQNPSNNPPPQ